MDLSQPALSILAGIITALFSVGFSQHYNRYKERKNILIGLKIELNHNKDRLENEKEGLKRIVFEYSNSVYHDLMRKGIYYELSEEIQKGLSELYADISGLNAMSGHIGEIQNKQKLSNELENIIKDHEILLPKIDKYNEENKINKSYFRYIIYKIIGI